MANEKKIISRFQFRRDSTQNWLQNKDTIPAPGEPCYDINLKTLKIGDGSTTYENLPVIGGASGDSSALQSEINALKIAMQAIQLDIEDMEEQVGETNVIEIHHNVTQLVTEMETTKTEMVTVKQTLDAKADVQTVSELQTAVNQKVDVEVVETLESDLKTYIDDQIKNIDDGEI